MHRISINRDEENQLSAAKGNNNARESKSTGGLIGANERKREKTARVFHTHSPKITNYFCQSFKYFFFQTFVICRGPQADLRSVNWHLSHSLGIPFLILCARFALRIHSHFVLLWFSAYLPHGQRVLSVCPDFQTLFVTFLHSSVSLGRSSGVTQFSAGVGLGISAANKTTKQMRCISLSKASHTNLHTVAAKKIAPVETKAI